LTIFLPIITVLLFINLYLLKISTNNSYISSTFAANFIGKNKNIIKMDIINFESNYDNLFRICFYTRKFICIFC